METVKKSVDRGVDVTMAIKGALLLNGLDVSDFADKYGFPRPTVSQVVNGAVRPTDAMLTALIKELGGDPDGWRELLWLAGKPAHVGKVKLAAG